MAGEEDSVAHHVQVKERRNGGEEAYSQGGSTSGGCAGAAMDGPIQRLGQAGNAENDDQVSKQPRTERERSLLHAGIDSRGERDVRDLNQNDGEPAVRTARGRRRQVHQRARGRAEKGALPVPAGDGPRKERAPAIWEHVSMVADD